MRYTLTREVTKEECPWLDEDLPKGTLVYKYRGHTYGCIGPGGMAVTKQKDTTPFFEVPANALLVYMPERIDKEWLRRKIEEEPDDAEIGAGTDVKPD